MKFCNITAAIVLSMGCLASTLSCVAQEESEFATQTIDIGVVVSDQEASLKFYTKALGMQEVPGFEVGDDLAIKSGLTKQSSLSVKVVRLGEEKTATSLKLVKVNGATSAKQPNDFIETQAGFSYITLKVKDMAKAVARLKENNVKILAEGPAELPASLAKGVFLTLVRDPDGNFVELVGPNAGTAK